MSDSGSPSSVTEVIMSDPGSPQNDRPVEHVAEDGPQLSAEEKTDCSILYLCGVLAGHFAQLCTWKLGYDQIATVFYRDIMLSLQVTPEEATPRQILFRLLSLVEQIQAEVDKILPVDLEQLVRFRDFHESSVEDWDDERQTHAILNNLASGELDPDLDLDLLLARFARIINTQTMPADAHLARFMVAGIADGTLVAVPLDDAVKYAMHHPVGYTAECVHFPFRTQNPSLPLTPTLEEPVRSAIAGYLHGTYWTWPNGAKIRMVPPEDADPERHLVGLDSSGDFFIFS